MEISIALPRHSNNNLLFCAFCNDNNMHTYYLNGFLHSLEGAYFHLSDSPDLDIEYMCKLGTDHRQIIISNGHLPINMRQILEVKTLQGEGEWERGEGREGEGVHVYRVWGIMCFVNGSFFS